MFFWFVGIGAQLVRSVFRSRAIDYRILWLGLLLPAGENLAGRAGPLHTLAAPAVILVLVPLLARGSRLASRRWVALPIGMMVHLLLDGTWLRRELFWWPLTGGGEISPPEVAWPLEMLIAGEVLGFFALWRFLAASEAPLGKTLGSIARTGRLPGAGSPSSC